VQEFGNDLVWTVATDCGNEHNELVSEKSHALSRQRDWPLLASRLIAHGIALAAAQGRIVRLGHLVLDRHFAQCLCKIDMIGQGAAAGAGELLQILEAAMDFQRDPDAGADAAAYVFAAVFFFDQHQFVAHERHWLVQQVVVGVVGALVGRLADQARVLVGADGPAGRARAFGRALFELHGMQQAAFE
jgi:hypothetical protein